MSYLHLVRSTDDPWSKLVKDDPVRPEIPLDVRIGTHAEILILINEQDEAAAALCVRYCQEIPSNVEELLADPGGDHAAIFYTIWSYGAGAGGKMIFSARDHIRRTRPGITRFITLSPLTEMARKFHLRNGAGIFRENASTINYEYP